VNIANPHIPPEIGWVAVRAFLRRPVILLGWRRADRVCGNLRNEVPRIPLRNGQRLHSKLPDWAKRSVPVCSKAYLSHTTSYWKETSSIRWRRVGSHPSTDRGGNAMTTPTNPCPWKPAQRIVVAGAIASTALLFGLVPVASAGQAAYDECMAQPWPGPAGPDTRNQMTDSCCAGNGVLIKGYGDSCYFPPPTPPSAGAPVQLPPDQGSQVGQPPPPPAAWRVNSSATRPGGPGGRAVAATIRISPSSSGVAGRGGYQKPLPLVWGW
jgi:hypothetical protein